MCRALRWALSYRCEETQLESNLHRADILLGKTATKGENDQ